MPSSRTRPRAPRSCGLRGSPARSFTIRDDAWQGYLPSSVPTGTRRTTDMRRHGRTRGDDLDAPHPLEKVIGVVSADSFEPDHGAREDRWAQNVRRDVDAKLAALRRQ